MRQNVAWLLSGFITKIGALSFFSKLFNESGCSLYATWLALSVVLVSMGECFTPPLRNTQDVVLVRSCRNNIVCTNPNNPLHQLCCQMNAN